MITGSSTTSSTLTVKDIDRRIQNLRHEANHIQSVYKKLTEFLHANAMLPFNDAVVDYLDYFIKEENTKRNFDVDNQQVINNLQKMKADFEKHIHLIRNAVKTKDLDKSNRSHIQPEEAANLIRSLYDLSIMGTQLEDQVRSIMLGQSILVNKNEFSVDLQTTSTRSKVMEELIELFEETTVQ